MHVYLYIIRITFFTIPEFSYQIKAVYVKHDELLYAPHINLINEFKCEFTAKILLFRRKKIF